MHRQTLAVIAAFILFSNFSCPTECEEFLGQNAEGADLTIDLLDPQALYTVGKEITMRATFPAQQATPQGMNYRISPNGGLVVTELYRITNDTVSLEAALNLFTVTAAAGELIAPPEGDLANSTIRLRYFCPDDNCSFAQTIRPQESGNYVMRITGGPVDEVIAPFNFCTPLRLSNTTLTGGGNAGPGVGEADFFYYRTPRQPFFTYINDGIVSLGQSNVLYFTVE